MENLFKVEGTDLIILVPAELDHYNAEKIKSGADRLIENRNIRRVIFDFKRTVFMDSSGIGVIMGRYKNIRFMGGEVMAIHVNSRIYRILTLSGIYKVIDICEEQSVQPEIF
ncbi:MAG: anti-sigma factor antagonist [Eubacteriales bacterium]|nr:anti-sigma factor antagonist [Eubacteriales bacterium]